MEIMVYSFQIIKKLVGADALIGPQPFRLYNVQDSGFRVDQGIDPYGCRQKDTAVAGAAVSSRN
jgi:hypothetical protein